MNIDWSSVIGGALGGIAFAVAAGLGTWIWMKIANALRKKPMFRIARKPGNRYFITKLRRGYIRDLQFLTGGNGISTSPGSQPELVEDAEEMKVNQERQLFINSDRDVDEIFLSWVESPKRGGNAIFENNTATVFADKKPRRRFKELFR